MTTLSPDDVRKALQVILPESRQTTYLAQPSHISLLGILGSSNFIQVHNQLDKNINLSPLPANLHDQKVSANGAHHHGLCDTVRFRKHISNHRTVHADRAHLGSYCSWDLHQPHGILVRKRFSEHHWRFLDTCSAHACYQKIAATSTTTIGFDDGLCIGRLVGIFNPSRFIMLTANQRLHHIDPANDHPQAWIQS